MRLSEEPANVSLPGGCGLPGALVSAAGSVQDALDISQGLLWARHPEPELQSEERADAGHHQELGYHQGTIVGKWDAEWSLGRKLCSSIHLLLSTCWESWVWNHECASCRWSELLSPVDTFDLSKIIRELQNLMFFSGDSSTTRNTHSLFPHYRIPGYGQAAGRHSPARLTRPLTICTDLNSWSASSSRLSRPHLTLQNARAEWGLGEEFILVIVSYLSSSLPVWEHL